MRKLVISIAALAGLAIAGLSSVYAFYGAHGLHALIWRGIIAWSEISPDDPRLTPAVRLALAGAVGTPGETRWTERAPGFETGETPIMVDGKEVDRLLLARMDPARWRFSVHSDPTGDHHLDEWMRDLGAVLVVNGSYFDHKGAPDTPFRGEGVDLGPTSYDSKHGAFVVAPDNSARLVDLKESDWRRAFEGARNALVSYPLLLDEKGQTRAKPSKWLANRSFLAEDRAGRIIVGTTKEAFLSLHQLGLVLRDAGLDLVLALNLDGGPLACQKIAIRDYKREHCGAMEVQQGDGVTRWLHPLTPNADMWSLPVAIAVRPAG